MDSVVFADCHIQCGWKVTAGAGKKSQPRSVLQRRGADVLGATNGRGGAGERMHFPQKLLPPCCLSLS